MVTIERMLLARKLVVIDEKYNIIRKIGGGSFGDIFLAINITDGEVYFLFYFNFHTGVLSRQLIGLSNRPCISGFLFLKMAVWAFS